MKLFKDKIEVGPELVWGGIALAASIIGAVAGNKKKEFDHQKLIAEVADEVEKRKSNN